MKKKLLTYILMSITILLSSCYGNTTNSESEDIDSVETNLDSIAFYSKRHYTEGYNFIVHADSLTLLCQQPEEMISNLKIDTFSIYGNHQLVVGDFRIIPQDSIDSVWVQVATDEGMFGWVREKDMLKNVVPVDPISRFIMFFSDTHIIASLVIISLIGIVYVFRITYRRNIPMVHLRDIPTFYPTLLCLIVATAATFYASLQMFAKDTWQHFYYHPSLNPLQMPFILSIFIFSVWSMLITAIATVDETRRHLSLTDNILYLASLCGMCAVLYIVFSLSTLYYIGYPLLIAYYYYALKQYFATRNLYICGNCGRHIRNKGVCPHCNAVNI